MDRLENIVRHYAWGSMTAIPDLLGVPPSGEPQAELWLGAHPAAPSTVVRDGVRRVLMDCIDSDPVGELGEHVVEDFGPRLPFLLKVLAAAAPLSLQAHPSLKQAREGFADEEGRGVPLDAPERNYKDASHKPELLWALTPFEAMYGFRPAEATVRLLDSLAVPELEPYAAALRARPDAHGVREAFTALMTMPMELRKPLVDDVLAGCARVVETGGEFAPHAELALELGEAYPGDVGVVSSLLVNRIVLEPGEAIYVPAGTLHAYVRGVAVEVMANSDNVLRGGLTPKHIDVAELLRVLDFTPGKPEVLHPQPEESGEQVFVTPAREFRLSRIPLDIGAAVELCTKAPQIVLCLEGEGRLISPDGRKLDLPRGASAYLRTAEEPVTIEGAGVVCRATVPHNATRRRRSRRT
jgi:mannose-6-phosphate isomerase